MASKDEKDTRPARAPVEADAPPPLSPAASKPLGRRPGLLCAPPPPLPPGFKFADTPTPDDYYDQPKVWACRRCCRNFNWTYRPPREEELDGPCVRYREVMDAKERAVEINRLLLAQLKAGPGFLALPVPAMAHAPTRRQRKTGAELLSKKEVARRLGVDRATTLEGLIASGNIKTVLFNGRVRVPVVEVERILSEGIPAVGTPRLRMRRPAHASTPKLSESPGEKIRKLKL